MPSFPHPASPLSPSPPGLTAQVLAPPADVDPALIALLGVGRDGRAQALAVAPGVAPVGREGVIQGR